MSKKRKWHDSYVQFGFTLTKTTKGLQKLQCMFCNIVFWYEIWSHLSCENTLTTVEHYGGADVSGNDVES